MATSAMFREINLFKDDSFTTPGNSNTVPTGSNSAQPTTSGKLSSLDSLLQENYTTTPGKPNPVDSHPQKEEALITIATSQLMDYSKATKGENNKIQEEDS